MSIAIDGLIQIAEAFDLPGLLPTISRVKIIAATERCAAPCTPIIASRKGSMANASPACMAANAEKAIFDREFQSGLMMRPRRSATDVVRYTHLGRCGVVAWPKSQVSRS